MTRKFNGVEHRNIEHDLMIHLDTMMDVVDVMTGDNLRVMVEDRQVNHAGVLLDYYCLLHMIHYDSLDMDHIH